MTATRYNTFDTAEEAQAENVRLEGLLGIPNEDGATGFDRGPTRRSVRLVDGEIVMDKYLICVIEGGKYATADLVDPDTIVELNGTEVTYEEEDN